MIYISLFSHLTTLFLSMQIQTIFFCTTANKSNDLFIEKKGEKLNKHTEYIHNQESYGSYWRYT